MNRLGAFDHGADPREQDARQESGRGGGHALGDNVPAPESEGATVPSARAGRGSMIECVFALAYQMRIVNYMGVWETALLENYTMIMYCC